MTTSWTNILHGNLVQAFNSNLFGPILYLAFTISALFGGYGYIRKIRFDTSTHKMNVVLKIIAAGLIVYGVFRFSTTKLNSPHSMESLRKVSSSPMSKDSGDSTRVPKEDSP
jgi:hypothetical protein